MSLIQKFKLPNICTDKKIKRPLIPEHCGSWIFRQYVHSTGKSYTTFQDPKSPKYEIVVSQAFMKRNIRPVFKSLWNTNRNIRGRKWKWRSVWHFPETVPVQFTPNQRTNPNLKTHHGTKPLSSYNYFRVFICSRQHPFVRRVISNSLQPVFRTVHSVTQREL